MASKVRFFWALASKRVLDETGRRSTRVVYTKDSISLSVHLVTWGFRGTAGEAMRGTNVKHRDLGVVRHNSCAEKGSV
jgi:hypothetical protein